MNLDFEKEQKMIRDEAVKFLKKECPYEVVKELEESDEGYSEKIWKKMATLGWMGLIFPEAYGGEGASFIELAIIQEVIGAAVFPSPFFSTVVQGGLILMEGGTEDQKKTLIPKIADGSMKLALAQYEQDGSYLVSDICMTAEATGDGYTLNGVKMFVMDANIADKLIVAAGIDGQINLFLVDAKDPGLTISKMPTIAMDNNCEVIFKDVKVTSSDIIGETGSGGETIKKMNVKACVAKSAEMIGGMKACLDMTNAYAKERVQYGKPIGGFQAIQHNLADMLMAYDLCYNYLYRIICKIDENEEFELDAYSLKAMTNEKYKFISERGVQIHGGIGTARECDVGLFYRKVKADEYICGDTDFHYDNIFEKLME